MNVIFDGNYLMHKTFGVFKVGKETEAGEELTYTEVFAEKESQAQFFRKLIIDFCYTVRQFDDVTKVIFTFDNPSWRLKEQPSYKNKNKPLDPMEALLEKENKEGRDMFYKIMAKLSKHLQSVGFPVSQLLDFEGDDVCYFYANHFSAKGEKCTIISGDKDLLQFIDENVSVYRNNSLAPAFFHTGDQGMIEVAEKIQGINKRLKIEEIDPIKHMFEKMLLGDKGDNVSNLFKGLGKATAAKMYNLAKENDYLDLRFNDLDYVLGVCEIVKAVSPKAPEIEDLAISLTDNVQIMWLDDSVYTPEQLEGISEEIAKKENAYNYEGEFTLTEILNKE